MSASASIHARKLPRKSRTPPATDPPHFRLLCWCMLGLAIAATSAGLLLDEGRFLDSAIELTAWFGIVLVAELGSIPLGKGFHLTFGLPLLLAVGFIYGPFAAGLLAFFGSADYREVRREISASHALFNRAEICLCVVASAYVFQAAQTGSKSLPDLVFPASLALVADMAVNSLFVMLGGRLKYGLNQSSLVDIVMLGEPGPFLGLYTAYGLLALVFAFLYWHAGPWAFVVFATPLILGREVFSRAKRLGDALGQVRAKDNALQEANSKIGDERRDERFRIASSLHDDVLQSLFNVTLHAQVLREDLRSGRLLELEEDMPQLLEATDSTAALLRQVIRDLRQSPLARGGLIETLRLLVKQLAEEANVEIVADLGESNLEPSRQLLLYQIAREGIQNAVHHSGANRIEISLAQEQGCVRFRVEDNGKGFVMREVDSSAHFGLQLMRERAQIAGGDLCIDSEPGGGTRIVLRVPCPESRGREKR